MATISLCMIVKNEEETLARCLNSIYDLVDEIIIGTPALPTGLWKLQPGSPKKYTDIPGTTILPPPETNPFQRLPWITACGWMPTTFLNRQSGKNFFF